MRAVMLLIAVALLQQVAWVDPARHDVRFVTTAEGVQLEVLDFGGSGRPFVLLAGLGNTAHVFDEFAPKLTTLGKVYAITRRGYGASSRPESGYDVSRLGDDVVAALKALGVVAPAVLVGHSYAGQELSYLASQHRDRIVALIYLDAAYRYAFDVPGDFERDFPSLPPPPPGRPEVTRQPFVLPEAERRQSHGSADAQKAIMSGGRQFTEIRVPALAIFASPHDIGAAPDPVFDRFDEAMTERQARAFERGVPGARVLRWAHASHYLFLTRESEVIGEVSAFIRAPG